MCSLSPHLSLALQVLESTKVNAIHKDHQVPSFKPRWAQSCFSGIFCQVVALLSIFPNELPGGELKIKIIFDIPIYKLPGEKTVHMLLNAKSTVQLTEGHSP